MEIENTFDVDAPPERVFAFLLDPNRIIACVPGAELGEVLDPESFQGRVKLKAGPIRVSFKGTARIIDRDEAAKTATLEGVGEEVDGAGSARMRSRMGVAATDAGSSVQF